jgi:hypothetical protein
MKIEKAFAECCASSPASCDCVNPVHTTAFYDATPAEAKAAELDDALAFCYALLAPGANANALIAFSPEIANRAHRALYERSSPKVPYEIMMRALQDACDIQIEQQQRVIEQENQQKLAKENAIEARAEQIYDGYVFDEPGVKPDWIRFGNSIMQRRARDEARDEL